MTNQSSSELPIVDWRDQLRDPEAMIESVHPVTESDEKVAGVLLAAGSSTRFGAANKLLAPCKGSTVVRQAARTLLDTSLDSLVAVVGYEAAHVEESLAGLDFDIVLNPAFRDGQSSSIRTGISSLTDNMDAAVFALGDMPFVDSESVAALVDAYDAGVGTALAAACNGRRGNPVLFDRSHFAVLRDVAGDVGGRKILLAGDDSVLVETGDPNVLVDIDTPGDLARSRE